MARKLRSMCANERCLYCGLINGNGVALVNGGEIFEFIKLYRLDANEDRFGGRRRDYGNGISMSSRRGEVNGGGEF